jgi:hypothetical protein
MALASFAIAQPLFSDFQAGAGFFVARRNQPIDIVLLVLVLTLVPGLVAVMLSWSASVVSPKLGAVTMASLVGLFTALIAHTTLVRFWSIDWVASASVSLAVGVLAAYLYSTWPGLRNFLTYLIPAPLAFALFFLLTAPVSRLVFTDTGTDVTGVEVDARTPVVFVIFDEFPVVSLLDDKGDLDADLFPNFAELASRSTWYKHTASAHDNTLWAVPALLTGTSPDDSLLPTNANYPGNLFTLLSRSYELHVIEPFTDLCPTDTCHEGDSNPLFDRLISLLSDALHLYALVLMPDHEASVSVSDPFNEFLGTTMGRVNEEASADQLERFAQFIAGIDSSPTALHFVHLFLPHSPFRYYPSGRAYNNGTRLDGQESEIWVEPFLAKQANQRHLLQVQTVDRLLGDLLDRLEAEGILDEALIVVTADHGVSFQPGTPRRAITPGNAYDVGLVPLFIKAPHQVDGSIDTRMARTIDVLPTIADFLDFDLPWRHDGRSLLGTANEETPMTVGSTWGDGVVLDDVEGGLAAARLHIESLFPRSNGHLELYALGNHHELLGANAEGVVSGSSGITATVEDVQDFAHVFNDGGAIPGFVQGYLTGEVHDDLQIALALGGRIQTIVPVFAVRDNRAKFSAILPDAAFLEGFNHLRLLAVSGSTGRRTVERINLQGLAFFELRFAHDGRVEALVDDEGRSWAVESDTRVVGTVDTATWLATEAGDAELVDLQLTGWAVNEASLEPVESVVFFSDSEFAGTVDVDVMREDIRNNYQDDSVLISGFVIRLPRFTAADGTAIRAFAISGGSAVEIGLLDSARESIESG